MQGLHLTADLYHCTCTPKLLTETESLAAICRRYTQEAGLIVVGEKWYAFPPYQAQPGGVTGVLLLAESHLALHTWPETSSVTLDVYVCNLSEDNSAKAHWLMGRLKQVFLPEYAQHQHLQRGIPGDFESKS